MTRIEQLQKKRSDKNLTKKEAKELQKLRLFEQMNSLSNDKLKGIKDIIVERDKVDQATDMDLLRLEYINDKL